MTTTATQTTQATQIPTAAALATLNELRKAAGKPPLAKWKEARSKLDDTIAKMSKPEPKSPGALKPTLEFCTHQMPKTLCRTCTPLPASKPDKGRSLMHPAPAPASAPLKSVAISKSGLTKEQEAALVAADKSQGKKKAKKAGASRARYDWDGAEEKAKKGTLPDAPDMSAPTHKHYVGKLKEVCKLARAGDVKGLQAYKVSDRDDGSPGLVKRYLKIAIIAVKAKG